MVARRWPAFLIPLTARRAPVGLTTDAYSDGHYRRKAAVISWLSVPVLS
jgi:hypothetical protein